MVGVRIIVLVDRNLDQVGVSTWQLRVFEDLVLGVDLSDSRQHVANVVAVFGRNEDAVIEQLVVAGIEQAQLIIFLLVDIVDSLQDRG